MMFKLSNSLPVFLAALIGLALPMVKQDEPAAKQNPFESVEVVQSQAEQLPSAADVLLQETYDRTERLGQVAHSLRESTEQANKSVATLVAKVSEIEAKQDEALEAAKKATGPGFKMPDLTVTECDCDCLTEAEIRKIVSDEFNNQMLAEAAAPRKYASPVTYEAPAVTYYQAPTVTYSSQPVTYSSPTTTYYNQAAPFRQQYRAGQPVRNLLRGSACVIDAFGNRICPGR